MQYKWFARYKPIIIMMTAPMLSKYQIIVVRLEMSLYIYVIAPHSVSQRASEV